MNPPRCLAFVLVGVFASLSFVEAAPSRKVLRKFIGLYEGRLSGAYGNSASGSLDINPVAFDRSIRHNLRTTIPVVTPTGNSVRLIWRTTTGNRRRVTMQGIYRGAFVNPNTGLSEQVSGIRKQTLYDRGPGRPRTLRYSIQVHRDEIREGSYAYTRVSGRLRRQ